VISGTVTPTHTAYVQAQATLAYQTGELQNKITVLGEAFGSGLLPQATAATTALNGMITPQVIDNTRLLGTAVADLTTQITTLGGTAKGVDLSGFLANVATSLRAITMTEELKKASVFDLGLNNYEAAAAALAKYVASGDEAYHHVAQQIIAAGNTMKDVTTADVNAMAAEYTRLGDHAERTSVVIQSAYKGAFDPITRAAAASFHTLHDDVDTSLDTTVASVSDHAAAMVAVMAGKAAQAAAAGAETVASWLDGFYQKYATGIPQVDALVHNMLARWDLAGAFHILGKNAAIAYNNGLIDQMAAGLANLGDKMGPFFAPIFTRLAANLEAAKAPLDAAWQTVGAPPLKGRKGPDLVQQAQGYANAVVSALTSAYKDAADGGAGPVAAIYALYTRMDEMQKAGMGKLAARVQGWASSVLAGKIPGGAEIQAGLTDALTQMTKTGSALDRLAAGAALEDIQKGAGAKVKTAIQAATDQTKAIADAVQAGIAALGKLTDFQAPAGLAAGIDQFAGAVDTVMMRLQDVALRYKSKGLEAISAWADASSKVFAALTAGVDLFSKLHDATARGVTFGGQLLADAQTLLGRVIELTTAYGALVPPWKDDQLAHVLGFADASTKVLGAISQGVDLFGKLTDATRKGVSYSGALLTQAQALAGQVIQITTTFGGLVPVWHDTMLTRTSTFADTSGKVLGAITAGADLFLKLQEATQRGVVYTGAWVATSQALGTGIVQVTTAFQAQAPVWEQENVHASAFADTAGKILGVLSPAFDLMSKIRDATARGVSYTADWVSTSAGLAGGIATVVTTFAGLMPAWEDTNRTTAAFADTSGKVLATLSAAFDLFAKIRDAGARGVSYSNVWVQFAGALAGGVSAVATTFRGLMPAWEDENRTTGAFADTAGKILSTLSSAFDVLRKVQEATSRGVTYTNDWVQFAGALSGGISAVATTFRGLIPHWEDENRTVSAFADTSGKILTVLNQAVDLFPKLTATTLRGITDTGVLAARAATLGDVLISVATVFAGRIPAWETPFVEGLTRFTDGGGKILTLLGQGLDFVTRLKGATVLGIEEITALGQQSAVLTSILLTVAEVFRERLPAWDAPLTEGITRFSDGAGKALTVLGQALTYIDALRSRTGLGIEDVTAFGAQTATLTNVLVTAAELFRDRIPDWETAVTDGLGRFADTAGKMLTVLGSTLTLIKSVTDAKTLTVSDSSLDTLIDTLVRAARRFAARVTGEWTPTGLDAAAKLADATGRIVDTIGKGVAGLMGLLTFVAPSDAAIDSFLTALGAFLERFAARARAWQQLGLDKAAEIAGYVGTVMGAIGAAVDALAKLPGVKVPSEHEVDVFFGALGVIVATFAARAKAWQADMSTQVVEFAGGVQIVMGAIGTAVDDLGKMADLAKKGDLTDAINSAFGNISLALQKARDLTGVLPPGDMAKVLAGAGQWNTLFTQLRGVLDNLVALQDAASKVNGADGGPLAAALAVVAGIGAALASAFAAGQPAAVSAARDYGSAIGQAIADGLRSMLAEVLAARDELDRAAGGGGGPPPYQQTEPPPPPVYTPPPGRGRPTGHGEGGNVYNGAIIVQGTLVATVPGATRDLLIGLRRAKAQQNPGGFG
jgi:hypothetical protein